MIQLLRDLTYTLTVPGAILFRTQVPATVNELLLDITPILNFDFIRVLQIQVAQPSFSRTLAMMGNLSERTDGQNYRPENGAST